MTLARVLIVDDNLMIRTLLRDMLTSGGHHVVGEALDGRQAEAAVRRLRPELVTLDLVMPTRGGLDTLPSLLAIDPALSVIVGSASLDQRRVLAALRLGAVGFVVKPFDQEAVLANVSDALAHAAKTSRTPLAGSAPAATVGSPPARGGSDQRDFVRVTCALAIRVNPLGGQPLVTVTVDISAGGVLLATGRLARGTRADFRLDLVAGQAPVTGRARAIRVDAEGRTALEFEHVSVEDHTRLNAYIRQHAPAT